MMMKKIILAAVMVILASPVSAQIAISQLPTAAVPLQGNEVVAGVQNGQTVQIPETAFGIQGPASAVSGHVATFSGTTGKLIQDSGVATGPYTGAVLGQLPGTTTNDNASAGNIGEYIESSVVSGSAVSLTTGVTSNVTSISLTAGDWVVSGIVVFGGNAATTVSVTSGALTTTSATLPTSGLQTRSNGYYAGVAVFGNTNPTQTISGVRLSLSTTTTVYLVANASFGTNTANAFGELSARRVR